VRRIVPRAGTTESPGIGPKGIEISLRARSFSGPMLVGSGWAILDLLLAAALQ